MPEKPPKDSSEFSAGQAALSSALNVSFKLLRGFMLLLFIGYLLSGMFVVKQHERAFVLVFGRVDGVGESRIKGPGAHWTWPRPFSEIVRVPTERAQEVMSLAFLFAVEVSEDGTWVPAPSGETLRPGFDGYSLTADANILHTRWTFQYTVKDPEAFYLRHKDGERLLTRLFEDAVVQSSAGLTLDESLRSAVERLHGDVLSHLRKSCAALQMGVQIENVRLLETIPPQQVFKEMNQVLAMATDAGTNVADARKEADKIRTAAIGEAERIRRGGQSAGQELLLEIQADAVYFEKIYAQYRENPVVIAQALRQTSVRRALKQVKSRYLIHTAGEGKQKIIIPLGPEEKSPLSPPKNGSRPN
jgi:membrane protease subunit HflK